MNKKLTLSSSVFAIALLAGCASSESPYVEGGGISSGTNIVSEKNFVVLFDETNPAVIDDEGLHGDVEVTVTINAADRLNLATTGATAYLDVSWGTLSATSCQITVDGFCTITWKSNGNFNDAFFPGDPLVTFDEFITFTAWIIGEESFSDLNGSGSFDDGDIFTNDSSGPFLDLDFSGDYSAGDKVLSPGNINGVLTAADGLYNGPGCTHSTLCSPISQIYISSRAILPIREIP